MREALPTYPEELVLTRLCPKCNMTKPLAEYYKTKKGFDSSTGKWEFKYQYMCKDCTKEYQNGRNQTMREELQRQADDWKSAQVEVRDEESARLLRLLSGDFPKSGPPK